MKGNGQTTPPRIRKSFLDAPARTPTEKYAWHSSYMRDYGEVLVPRKKKTVKQVYHSPYSQDAQKHKMSLLQEQQQQVALKNEPQYVKQQHRLEQGLIDKCEADRIRQLQQECGLAQSDKTCQDSTGFSKRPWPQLYQPRKECELALHDVQYGQQTRKNQPEGKTQKQKCWDDYLMWQLREKHEMSGRKRDEVLAKIACPIHGHAGPELVQKGIKAPPPRIYNLNLPVVPREPLPADITQPRMISLKAKCWKGIPLPFDDPRFEPLLPEDMDTAMMNMGGKNPFRYCDRKKKFPEQNRCPNLPVTQNDINNAPDLAGFPGSTWETKMFDKRQPHRRIPRAFLVTKFW